MLWGCLLFWGTALLVKGLRCKEAEVLVEVGSNAVLPCDYAPSTAFAEKISWSKASRGKVWEKQKSGLEYWGHGWARQGPRRVYCPHSGFGAGQCSLHIEDVKESDGGTYTCRVTDGDQLICNVVTLRVVKVSIYPPIPVEGNDVSFICNVTPWPKGATASWGLNGTQFMPQIQSKISMISKNAMNGKASQSLAGDWTCVVHYNEKEWFTTQSQHLSVRGIIVIPADDDTRVYAAVGSAVTLPCVFAPGYNPSDLVWEKMNTAPRSPSTASALPPSFDLSPLTLQRPWDRSARVMEVGPEDGGQYRCSGTIEGRSLTRGLRLVTASVESKAVNTRRAPSMTLTCHLSDPSEVTDYEWFHVTYDLNGTQSATSIGKGNVVSVNGVTGENSGEWTCRFYGRDGILGNATYHLHVMGGLTGHKKTGMSSDAVTVIGLSVLLLVLLPVLVKSYKNYQRRKRIFQYPAMETIVHALSNEREERERKRVKEDDVSK
ncbi:lymphocyte activation gene 3 protein-like [Lampris incognitus]|uniref:lymphocyte activation gene 3 protein-like n=1 Tax=Lampris incognitus TaxID=2546036 RepID=UPI0024B4C1B3|nr:lymphocyte activation gene 3 protein-like [Lampris incognitus]